MSVQAPPRRVIERTPPRRRVRRRSVWNVIVWPVVKYGALAAVIVSLAVVVAVRVARPLKLLNRESRETARIAADLESLKKENEALDRRIKYLQTPRGAAQAARKLGYVKPGEIMLVLPPEPPSHSKKAPGSHR